MFLFDEFSLYCTLESAIVMFIIVVDIMISAEENIALNKPTYQSSTFTDQWSHAVPGLAVGESQRMSNTGERERETERDRERQRETERDRERQRETERDRDREIEKQRGRETDMETQTETERDRERTCSSLYFIQHRFKSASAHLHRKQNPKIGHKNVHF